MTRVARAVVVAALLATVSPATPSAAQIGTPAPSVAQARDSVGHAVPEGGGVFVGAVLGSAIGLWGGLLGGFVLAYGDDALTTQLAAVSITGLGNVVGTTIGIELGSRGAVPLRRAVGASLVGVLGGVACAYLFDRASSGSAGPGSLSVGFALGQGITAASLSLLGGASTP